MRSLNTSVVALLPVGGLLFIGAGLLGAGTLKDLGLVLFVGMAVAFLTSILLATPVLVLLKNQDPRISAHNKRVLARRARRRPGRGRPPQGRRRVRAPAGDDADRAGRHAALAGVAAARWAPGRPASVPAAPGRCPAGGGGNRPGGAQAPLTAVTRTSESDGVRHAVRAA